MRRYHASTIFPIFISPTAFWCLRFIFANDYKIGCRVDRDDGEMALMMVCRRYGLNANGESLLSFRGMTSMVRGSVRPNISHANPYTHTDAKHSRDSIVSIHFCVICFCHKSSSCANGCDDVLAVGWEHTNTQPTIIRHPILPSNIYFCETMGKKWAMVVSEAANHRRRYALNLFSFFGMEFLHRNTYNGISNGMCTRLLGRLDVERKLLRNVIERRKWIPLRICVDQYTI